MKTSQIGLKKGVSFMLLVVSILILFTGCGSSETLYDITSTEKGGHLRVKEDKYHITEVGFYDEDHKCPKGKVNCCHVLYNVYKDAVFSPTGVIINGDKSTSECIPCEFDDVFLTLNHIDNYTYKVEKKGEYEYVVFSKEFLGYTEWYIDKSY